MWIWVSLPYATFGLKIGNGKIVEAAPIARWAVGKPAHDVVGYYRRKGAYLVPINNGLVRATQTRPAPRRTTP